MSFFGCHGSYCSQCAWSLVAEVCLSGPDRQDRALAAAPAAALSSGDGSMTNSSVCGGSRLSSSSRTIKV